jgi:hypothetical protein
VGVRSIAQALRHREEFGDPDPGSEKDVGAAALHPPCRAGELVQDATQEDVRVHQGATDRDPWLEAGVPGVCAADQGANEGRAIVIGHDAEHRGDHGPGDTGPPGVPV